MRAKLKIVSIMAVCFCALSAPPAQATLITIGIEAVVDDVHDSDNYLEGKINIGDLITGTYTYDTDTPDSSLLAGVGRYEHYAYPCGFSLTVGDLDFKSDFSPGLPEYFTIWITNDSSGVDGISVKSYNNLPLSDGTSVNNISWVLRDYSENAISSIELPTTAPVLNAWDFNFLQFSAGAGRGGLGSGPGGFGVAAHVTSAVVIPEPTTVLLFGLGGLILTRRSKK